MQCEGVAWIKMAKGKLLLSSFQQGNEPLGSERHRISGLIQCPPHYQVEPCRKELRSSILML